MHTVTGACAEFLANAVQPPSPAAVTKALQTLVSVNALDESERLTPLGFHLASLPVDVHVGKMLLYGAIFKVVPRPRCDLLLFLL